MPKREEAIVDEEARTSPIGQFMRRDVRRLFRKYGFPPDLQDDAVRLVIQQAEALAQGMARAA